MNAKPAPRRGAPSIAAVDYSVIGIGKRLRAARVALRMKQIEVARLSTVSPVDDPGA